MPYFENTPIHTDDSVMAGAQSCHSLFLASYVPRKPFSAWSCVIALQPLQAPALPRLPLGPPSSHPPKTEPPRVPRVPVPPASGPWPILFSCRGPPSSPLFLGRRLDNCPLLPCKPPARPHRTYWSLKGQDPAEELSGHEGASGSVGESTAKPSSEKCHRDPRAAPQPPAEGPCSRRRQETHLSEAYRQAPRENHVHCHKPQTTSRS